ncbi:asparagine synthase-related protein [Pandoraea bronchicola]|uniref:Asparagine synthase (Glutamine-hydrolyzing) n=1 Tax=Pandoraea bronchicola TaxID=2508287 RepID=A0A5E5C136_9BURK|nr:asparagine synthase-related protein [Pandoraea bronchicola]VVE90273.1 asparagine synthase (glutamine-hydrolyzing) [Pandoraea bronchicola]
MKLARLRPGPAERYVPLPGALVLRGLDGQPVARIRPEGSGDRQHSSGQSELLAWYVSGRVFRKGDGNEVPPGLELARMAIESPERFVERYWGHYRIIVHDRWCGATLVLCDPCGHCPTYYRFCRDGAVHVASDPASIADASPTFDSAALKSFLVHGDLGGAPCALYDVERLPLGHALWIPERGAPKTRVVWWPSWRSRAGTSEIGEASSGEGLLGLLRRSAERCLGDRPAVLELSGGVESTSLALALAESGRAGTCTAVNHRDPASPSSDASHHAHSVARHVGMALEHFDIECAAFSPPATIPRLPRPAMHLCTLARLDAVRERLTSYPGHRLVNGHGGDAIFLASPPDGAFLDAFADGQWRRAFGAWRDLAVMQRMPLWRVLQGAFAQLGLRQANPRATRAGGLLTMAACDGVAGRMEPLAQAWLAQWPLRLRPGKRAQILGTLANLRDIEVSVSLAADGTMFPFLTQPVVEAGFAMPAYRLFNAIHNRLPLRRAAYLASGLPNLWRLDKGMMTGIAGAGVAANLRHVEEVCLEGYCAASGWIDRDTCRRAIGGIAHHHLESMTTIRRLYALETFVRGWRQGTSRSREAAA